MPRYYAISDVHGFYEPMHEALENAGFFDFSSERKLIVCGDMMDRGKDTLKVQEFMNELYDRGELIFIRGNHEDMMIDLINKFEEYKFDIARGHHVHVYNGTWGAALDLSGMDKNDALRNPREFKSRVRASVFYGKLIPASVDYFETDEYIFTHGWIPRRKCDNCPSPQVKACWGFSNYDCYDPDWRNADKEDWDRARWRNGMDEARWYHVIEIGKKIVCGHWHASYGHSIIDGYGSEFGKYADFTPYFGDGIVAIDGCTVRSGITNCFVVAGDEMDIIDDERAKGLPWKKKSITFWAN